MFLGLLTSERSLATYSSSRRAVPLFSAGEQGLAVWPSGSDLSGAKATVTLHWMKGRRSTKIGIRVRTIKSRKSHRASPPTFRRAISLTCRLSQYHWLSSWRSKQTRITFRATGEHTSAKGSQRCFQCPSQTLGEG